MGSYCGENSTPGINFRRAMPGGDLGCPGLSKLIMIPVRGDMILEQQPYYLANLWLSTEGLDADQQHVYHGARSRSQSELITHAGDTNAKRSGQYS